MHTAQGEIRRLTVQQVVHPGPQFSLAAAVIAGLEANEIEVIDREEGCADAGQFRPVDIKQDGMHAIAQAVTLGPQPRMTDIAVEQ